MFDFGYQFKWGAFIMFFAPLLVLLGIFFIIKHYARNKKAAYIYLAISMIALAIYTFYFLPGFFYAYGYGPIINK